MWLWHQIRFIVVPQTSIPRAPIHPWQARSPVVSMSFSLQVFLDPPSYFVHAFQLFPWSPGITLTRMYVGLTVSHSSASSSDVPVLRWPQTSANRWCWVCSQMACWPLELFSVWSFRKCSFSSDQLFQKCFGQQSYWTSAVLSLFAPQPMFSLSGQLI